MRVALDLEVTNGRSAAAVASWGADVQSELHARLGRKPLLYTFIGFAKAGNCAAPGQLPALDRRSVQCRRRIRGSRPVEGLGYSSVRHQRRYRP